MSNGAIEVYQLHWRLLNFHFGLEIRRAAAIGLRLLVVYGLEVLYLPQVFPDGIQCHFTELTIAAKPR